MNFERYDIFPTPVFEFDVPPEIYAQLLSLCTTVDWDTAETYAGGSSSCNVLNFPKQDGILSYSDFVPFSKWAEEQLDTINNSIPGNYSSNVRINAAWMNRYQKGDYNRAHSHPWSLYSGVVFLTGNSGNMVFIKPNPYNEEVLKITNVHDTVPFQSQGGKMVVFPSSLQHFVTENENETIRYTLAFNAMPDKVDDGHTVQFNNCHTNG